MSFCLDRAVLFLDRADGFAGGVRVESAEGQSPRRTATELRVSSGPKGRGKTWLGKWAHLGVLFWIEVMSETTPRSAVFRILTIGV